MRSQVDRFRYRPVCEPTGDQQATPLRPTPAGLKRARGRLASRHAQRRGAGLVLAVVLMFTLFSFLAFSIDVGYLSQSRAELRRTADAAALAGCWEVYEQATAGVDLEDAKLSVREQAASIARLNPVCREGPKVDSSATSEEIAIGYLANPTDPSISADSSHPYYAVRVRVLRTADSNGEIPFFFGRIFGGTGKAMEVGATAVMAHNVRGFSIPSGSNQMLPLLPFALDAETWDAMMATGEGATDNYAYDEATDSVGPGSDSMLEVNLFPQGTGSPGNRGTVDIGHSSNSTSDLKRQIVHGISEWDLEALGKPLVFDLDSGSLTLNGNTGISAGMKGELDSIIGQKRIIPIFSAVSGNGNNADYTITRWVGVRVIDVKLTGSMSSKRVLVQPAPMVIDFAVAGTEASTSSDFLFSPVILAQ